MPKKKKEAELESWREKHFDELEKNLQVLIAIRDDPSVEPKTRVNAAHEINRLMGVSHSTSKKKAEKSHEVSIEKPEIPEDKLKELQAIIGEL